MTIDKKNIIALSGFAIILLGCLTYQINRPPAQGDEINFWYSATERIRFQGFDFHLKNHFFGTYHPGYPLVTALLTALVPASLFHVAVRLVPFFTALAICAFVLSGTKNFKNWAGFIALLLILQMFFLHWRIHAIFFHAWSTKALLVLSLAAIFKVVEEGSHWLITFGLAALAQLLKPPVSLLLPYYLLAAMPLCLWLARKERRRQLTWTFVALLAGSIAAQILWHAVLQTHSKTDMHDLNGQTVAAFNPHIFLTRLIPYLASEYTSHLIAFALTVLMGLMWPRQFSFPLLMVLFMSATIFVIFAKVTSINHDYQAGVRYLFQGFYGWQCYFLYKKLPVLTRCLKI